MVDFLMKTGIIAFSKPEALNLRSRVQKSTSLNLLNEV
jgi:hypothetical protein